MFKKEARTDSKKLKEAIDKLEELAKISVREYVGFGVIAPAALKYIIENGYVRVVEINAENNKLHGRGIRIWSNGDIHIKCYNNGRWATGTNYIDIFSSGEFNVGYIKDDNGRSRGTIYFTDRTTRKFDH